MNTKRITKFLVLRDKAGNKVYRAYEGMSYNTGFYDSLEEIEATPPSKIIDIKKDQVGAAGGRSHPGPSPTLPTRTRMTAARWEAVAATEPRSQS